MHTCPVCGYDQLEYAPADFNICPSCGTEFGYHDANFTHAQIRQRWLAAGAQWWDRDTPPPPNWSPMAQLRNIGYELTAADVQAIGVAPVMPHGSP